MTALNDTTINICGAVHIFGAQALCDTTAEINNIFCILMDHRFNPW